MGNWIQGASGIWTQKVWDSRPNRLEPETLVYLTSHTDASRDWWNIDQNLKSIKYGSGITLNAVTANLSIVDGTAFITNPSVDLRPYIGMKLSISDGTKALVGYAKAAGTGETLGDSLSCLSDITGAGWFDANTARNDANTFTLSSVGGYIGIDNKVAIGKLYKSALIASAVPTAVIYLRGSSANPIYAQSDDATSRYGTSVNTVIIFASFPASSGMVIDITSATMQQVLAPSATGITIVSTKGGTTYNWTSNGGINPNAASFTITITKE